MQSKIIISASLVSAILLVILHNMALELSWFYLYPYTNILLHIIGGFSVGLLVYIVLMKWMTVDGGVTRPPSRWWSLYIIIFGTFLISIVWEVVELIFYLTNDAGLSSDTVQDILFGILGGLLAWLFIQILPEDKGIDA
jgi:hypothetical protein